MWGSGRKSWFDWFSGMLFLLRNNKNKPRKTFRIRTMNESECEIFLRKNRSMPKWGIIIFARIRINSFHINSFMCSDRSVAEETHAVRWFCATLFLKFFFFLNKNSSKIKSVRVHSTIINSNDYNEKNDPKPLVLLFKQKLGKN